MSASLPKTFRRGDRVSWNSEAGRVTGVIQRKVTRQIVFKGYKRRASPDELQYIIKSERTDHVAIHRARRCGDSQRKRAERNSHNESRRSCACSILRGATPLLSAIVRRAGIASEAVQVCAVVDPNMRADATWSDAVV
jgi:hypothetical protein